MKRILFVGIIIAVLLALYIVNNKNEVVYGDLVMENVEALSQNDISHTGSWEKVVTNGSEFVGYETEVKNDSAIVYECYVVYEITECYGIGDVPCENGESECGMERVRVL